MEQDINKLILEQYIRRLYTLSGKTNLYVSMRCKEKIRDKKRIISEIQVIKGLVENIEYVLDNI